MTKIALSHKLYLFKNTKKIFIDFIYFYININNYKLYIYIYENYKTYFFLFFN